MSLWRRFLRFIINERQAFAFLCVTMAAFFLFVLVNMLTSCVERAIDSPDHGSLKRRAP